LLVDRTRGWRRAEDGAVAATTALALFGLVAVGGLAFDYSRMAALDSELQSAADQAALAAASQLDGKTGAITRATSAAQTLIANQTLLANDGGTRAITIPTIRFYRDKEKTVLVTADATANFVEVTVGARRAFYALTPVVALINSGDLRASALAGLSTAMCRVPPTMICNPDEPAGNSDPNFPFNADAYRGFGMRLVGDGSYAPGNFGYLETGFGSGANNLLKALAYNTPPGSCVPETGVDTKPGMTASVIDGINTRFDIIGTNACPDGGTCSPSINTRKDLVRNPANCQWDEVVASSTDFQSKLYRPASAAYLPTTTTPVVMGFPRDLCHAWSLAGNCTRAGGRIGNGDWDRDAYFRSNYKWDSATWKSNTGLTSAATRYQVYQWEIANPAQVPDSQPDGTGNFAYNRPVAGMCRAPGLTPGPTTDDRRRISTAVINCIANDVNGAEEDLPVVAWIDVFLVEPSLDRRKCKNGSGCNDKVTEKTDVYVEIIGESVSGATGLTGSQVTRRDVPYLIE
jgi:Flp pilus assembly protein TadG